MGFYDYYNSLPKTLDQDEQDVLIRSYKSTGDEEARELLIKHNLRLAAHCVRKTVNKSLDLDDYMQIATIELMKALDRYDISKGTKFSTFAYTAIHGRLLVTQKLQGIQQKKRDEQYELYEQLQKNGYFERKEDLDEMAKEMGSNMTEKELIAQFLSQLDKNDLYIFEHIFGLNGKECKSVATLAEEMDRSIALIGAKIYRLKNEFKEFMICGGRTPENIEREIILDYYKRTDNARHKEIIEKLYGLNGCEKTNLNIIAQDMDMTPGNIYILMGDIKKRCGLVDKYIELTDKDYIDYMTTCIDKIDLEILEYYIGINGKDKTPVEGICDEMNLDYGYVAAKIKTITNKIGKLRQREKMLYSAELISMEDMLEYYEIATADTQRFMDVLYGLHGEEKNEIDVVAEKLGVQHKTILDRKIDVENAIKSMIFCREHSR